MNDEIALSKAHAVTVYFYDAEKAPGHNFMIDFPLVACPTLRVGDVVYLQKVSYDRPDKNIDGDYSITNIKPSFCQYWEQQEVRIDVFISVTVRKVKGK